MKLLSGIRPTGKLHIGHLFGVIENWKKLQNKYNCYFEIATWHALTTIYQDTTNIKHNIIETVIDLLSAGISPEKAVIFNQADIKEIAQIHILLSMIVPVSWLERVPSYKGQIQQLGSHLSTYGFLGYPLLMTADILSVKSEVVPVGQDQLPHLEFTREVIRRFHYIFKENVFPEPKHLLTEFASVPGIDGRKMSKSYNNAIYLSDTDEQLEKKIKKTITDTQKIRKNDPGHPEVCNIFYYHKLINKENIEEIEFECKKGTLGCVACKKMLTKKMKEFLQPLRQKRQYYQNNIKEVKDILLEGKDKMQDTAKDVLKQMQQAIKMEV